MYVCHECKSTEFEKVDGFLYCLVCQIQQKDYIEYMNAYEPIPATFAVETNKAVPRRKLHERKELIENWTAWDAYNLILLGFLKELSDTGLTPKNLKSVVLSLWMGYLAKSIHKKKKFRKRKHTATKTYSQRKDSQRMSSQGKSLEEDSELLHIHKKRKLQGKNDEEGHVITPLSQLSTCSMKQLEKSLVKRHYQDFLRSEESKLTDIFANETIETIGRHSEGDADTLNNTHATDALSYPSTSATKHMKPPVKKKWTRKAIPMCKGTAIAILHIGLLMCGSDVQLSDLLRFIREAHLSYAKVTHFLPPEIKLTRENYLETVNDRSMPSHMELRKLGADVVKVLNIEVIPFPDFPRLIKRYVNEMRLPVLVSSYAVLISRLGNVRNLCSLKRASRRIPNYEGMAAACIIVALKFLFGLDDRTEFLLSDVAKKTNKILKIQTGNDNCAKLFEFVEWKKLIELRKTILSGVHYPTQERLHQNLSATGFLDMVIKESKDPHREGRFEFYNQYHIKPELTTVCKELLDVLILPKDKYTMEFPATLKPQTKYLKAIIKDYEERKKQKTPESSSGCIQFSEITEWVMSLLVKPFEQQQVFFMHKPNAYKEFLRKNGYKIRTLSKRDQIKLMGDSKYPNEESGDEYYKEDEEQEQEQEQEDEGEENVDVDDDSDSGLDGEEDLSDFDKEGISNKKAKPGEEGKLDDRSSNEIDATDKMDLDEEESEIRSGEPGEKEKERPPLAEEEGVEMKPNMRNWTRMVIKEDGNEFKYYVGKPGNRSFMKIDTVPKKEYKGFSWSDIRYSKLHSSKKVYFVKDMAVMWKLDSPRVSEDCDNFFMLEVFRKTPHNFQWITRQFSLMLEMKIKEIYVECYKLERVLVKEKNFSPAKIKTLLT